MGKLTQRIDDILAIHRSFENILRINLKASLDAIQPSHCSLQFRGLSLINPLSPGIKLQILVLGFHTFLTEVVERSC